ncbi:hypothetical protein P9112_004215 [Eukaryota sp. TZLM1-RC]
MAPNVSSFLGDVLAIPQIHDLIGTNAETFHNVFSFYSMGTNRMTENQFVVSIKRLNLNCENMPTPAVRQIFHELIEEYKGLERNKPASTSPSSSPASLMLSPTMNASSQNPDSIGTGPRNVVKSISFIQFVEGLIRIIYDKFAHLKQYTLCEKLEFTIASRLAPHVEEIEAAKKEEAHFTACVEQMTPEQKSTLTRIFSKYSTRDTKYSSKKELRMTHSGWIKFLKEGMWIGGGLSMMAANNIFTKLTGESVRSAVVGASHGVMKVGDFFKAVAMVSHVLYSEGDALESFLDELIQLKM